MKKSLLFLFVFVMLCLPTMAQPKIRYNGVPDKLSIIKTNTSLVRNQRYYSDNKRYALVFQKDGNLVLYKFSAPEKYSPIWNTSTQGNFIVSCIFQADGNLVLYGKLKNEQKAMWNSRKNSKSKEDAAKSWVSSLPPYGIDSVTRGSTAQADDPWLQVQDDGNLVIYRGEYPNGSVIWASETFEKN
jgi:hypothetical protein